MTPLKDADPSRRFMLPPTPIARVLVVDDIHDITRLLAAYLAQRGYEVACAYDGVQTIESALFFRPHIIVLNVCMPRLCGDRAVGYLNVHPATKDARIILTSGFHNIEEIARRVGADAFLQTPYPMSNLYREVTRLLALDRRTS